MAESDEPILNPAYRAGQIEALQYLLEAVVRELPPRAMYNVSHAASEFQKRLDNEARTRDRDDLRNKSAGAYDACTQMQNAIEVRLHDHEAGGALHTIMPAPIAKEDQIFPDLGW